jgi:gluconate kinase
MVLIITGPGASARNTVGRFLAEALGWEFVDAEDLARRGSASQAHTGPASLIETLTAAINFWVYEWRDVVVSCPMLTETDGRQLCRDTSLVRIVYLKMSYDAGWNTMLDKPEHSMNTGLATSKHTGQCLPAKALTVDSSQGIEDIITQVISALLLDRRSTYANTG